WWMTLLRGVVWMLFGVAVLTQPGVSLLTLTLMFGLFAFADGVGTVVSAVGGRHEYRNWWVLLLAGLTGILVGVLTVASPGTTALALLYYIAFWAIITGLVALIAAVHLRREVEGEFWLGLTGLASVAVGVALVARPGPGALAVLWLIGSYSIVIGGFLVALAFKARAFVHHVTSAVKGVAAHGR